MSAFLREAGDVDLALRIAVTRKAGATVIFREKAALGFGAVLRHRRRKGLILWPTGRLKLGLDDLQLPFIRLNLRIAEQARISFRRRLPRVGQQPRSPVG